MDLDLLISQYADDLMAMKDKWSRLGIKVQENAPEIAEEKNIPQKGENGTQNDPDSADEETDTKTAESPLKEEVFADSDSLSGTDGNENSTVEPETALGQENEEMTSEEENDTISDAAEESLAEFSARVFTGENAYPVENAKIMLYKDKKLYHFLITDESGKTPTIKIKSSPEENSLIPSGENQELDYLADVFADGFTPAKGLLVSAVGKAKILLEARLIPIEERID